MSIQSEEARYRTFLLTVWREDDENLRFMLQDPRSGRRKGFSTIGTLVDYLLEKNAIALPPADYSDHHD